VKLRDVWLERTGNSAYAAAQYVAYRLRSMGFQAEQGCKPSPAGDWASEAYITTDAPLPKVRSLLQEENHTVRVKLARTIGRR
jgi:hypothetical protein